MTKEKSLIVPKENIFRKLLKIIKNIFMPKNKNEDISTVNKHKEAKRESFIDSLQESNKNEKIIEKVSKDINILYNMSVEELRELNRVIKIKQNNLNNKVLELKLKIKNFN